MSPLSLSRQSSMEHMLTPTPEPAPHTDSCNTWQALCECEMVVNLDVCGSLDLTSDSSDNGYMSLSYEVLADPNWAISGSKTGKFLLTDFIFVSGSFTLCEMLFKCCCHSCCVVCVG